MSHAYVPHPHPSLFISFSSHFPFEQSLVITMQSILTGNDKKANKRHLATDKFKNKILGAYQVAQWLRVCLPIQGTWVRALVWKDPTCHGATKPMHHNY